MSSPEPFQAIEGECSVKIRNIVMDVENEAAVATAVLGSTQASAYHLKIEIRTVYGSGYDDGASPGRIETLGLRYARRPARKGLFWLTGILRLE